MASSSTPTSPPVPAGSTDAAAASVAAAEEAWRPSFNPWVVAMTVTLATFMEVLDTSIANVSLPHIAGSLSVTQDESTWVLTSYLVSNAIVLPVSGWIASKVGRKRFYMTCVALFSVCSLLCGMAPSLGWLVFFRVLQGAGGGGLGPSEQAILIDTFPPAKRGMAFAMYGMAVVLAPAIGPTLGGYITDHYSWRWVFFINIPVGCLSLILSSRIVEDPPYLKRLKAASGGIDFVGLMLITVGLGSLEVVLDKGQESDWFESSFIVGFALVAAVALIVFVAWELNNDHPIVDLRLFGKTNFSVANLMMLVLGMVLFGTTVLLPLYLQALMGYTAEQAGMALSPGGIVVILMLPMVGKLVGVADLRFLISFGFAQVAFALYYMTQHISLTMDFNTAMSLRMIQSVGMAFLFVPINTMATMGMPRDKSNSISGLINLSRNMGGDIGIAMVTTLIARHTVAHQTRLVQDASTLSSVFQSRLAGASQAMLAAGGSEFTAQKQALGILYGTVVKQAVNLAYIDVLWIFGLFALLMAPLVFVMKSIKTSAPSMGH